MTPLRPLRDDPATAEGLRRALQHETELPVLVNTAAVKAGVVSGILTGGGAAGAKAALGLGLASKLSIAGAAIVAAVGGGLWWQTRAASPIVPAVVATVASQVVPPLEPAPEPAAPITARLPAGLDDSARPIEPAPPRATTRTPRPPRAATPTAVPDNVDGATETPIIVARAPPSPSQLAAQLALYDRGRLALQRGALAEAVAAFETYLRAYPAGALEVEASLSLLEASMRAGQHAAVVALARRLASREELASRRGELLRAQGEALARLGRCDEAEQVLEQARGHADARLSAAQAEAAVASCRAADDARP